MDRSLWATDLATERQLVKKLMSGLVLVGNFFSFMALEGRSFVHVLSKEAGLHQQHTSS